MKKEGEGRGKKIWGRKRPSPFSTLKSSPHSFLSFPSYLKSQPPFSAFLCRGCG
jgi:hypothetical protein